MAGRGADQTRTVARTKIAKSRLEAGVTQRALAEAVGLPLATYRRLERGQMDNPPFRWLVNIFLALDLDSFDEVLEEDWWLWMQLRAGAPDEPPDTPTFLGRDPR